jgi:hypothetical protein
MKIDLIYSFGRGDREFEISEVALSNAHSDHFNCWNKESLIESIINVGASAISLCITITDQVRDSKTLVSPYNIARCFCNSIGYDIPKNSLIEMKRKRRRLNYAIRRKQKTTQYMFRIKRTDEADFLKVLHGL